MGLASAPAAETDIGHPAEPAGSGNDPALQAILLPITGVFLSGI
jgi:hypothetical protein